MLRKVLCTPIINLNKKMKRILITTISTILVTTVWSQEVKDYKITPKAEVFEVNVVSSDVIIEGYDGKQIIVKETIMTNGNTKKEEVFLIKMNEDDITFNSNSEKFSKEKEERKKGLKPIEKEVTFNNATTLEEKEDKVILRNFDLNQDEFHRMMMIDFKKSKFEIKVPNSMKIIVKKSKSISPFMLGKDTQFKVKNFKGEIELASLNQDIILENISNSTLVNTMLGDIEATFNELNKGAVISLITTAGFVDVSVPQKEKITFDLESMTGEILTNLDLKAKNEGRSMNQKYKAYYNGGGKVIQLKTTAGDIYIRKE